MMVRAVLLLALLCTAQASADTKPRKLLDESGQATAPVTISDVPEVTVAALEAVAAGIASTDQVSMGVDLQCVMKNCGPAVTACLLQSDCNSVTDTVTKCRDDKTLGQLVSPCNPVPQNYDPSKPIPPLRDQCVNLAVYQYKDNAAYYNLTRCAQVNGCLTGVNPEGCEPQKNNGTLLKSPSRGAWEATWDAMAAMNTTWDDALGKNFQWCVRGFKHTFSTINVTVSGRTVKRRITQYTVNINESRKAFKLLQGLKRGDSSVTWTDKQVKIRWDPTITSYRMEMYTAGVFESDPWLLMTPYPPLSKSRTPQAVLLVTSVNVGPVKLPLGYYGVPDGNVFVPEGQTVPAAALKYWQRVYGIDFANTWCNASRLWWND